MQQGDLARVFPSAIARQRHNISQPIVRYPLMYSRHNVYRKLDLEIFI